MILKEIISRLDLPMIMQNEGIHLRRSGNGYQFKCCFHPDKHPSGSLRNNGKWRFHCFGCGASGDAVDFVMRRHNIDFKAAASYFGIEKAPLTLEEKARIKKHKQQQKITETFERWELAAIDELRNTIFSIYRVSRRFKTVEDLELYGGILEPLAGLQGNLDVLMFGSEVNCKGLYRRWKDRGNSFF